MTASSCVRLKTCCVIEVRRSSTLEVTVDSTYVFGIRCGTTWTMASERYRLGKEREYTSPPSEPRNNGAISNQRFLNASFSANSGLNCRPGSIGGVSLDYLADRGVVAGAPRSGTDKVRPTRTA